MARLRILFDPTDDPIDPSEEVIFDLQLTPFDRVNDLGQMVGLTKRFLSSLSQNPRSKAQNKDQGQNNGQNGSSEARAKVNPEVIARVKKFDLFWDAFPRRVKKLEAQKVWARVVRTHDADLIIAAAERYRDDPNRRDEFTKHPTTWLNQGCWEDESLPQRHVNGNGHHPGSVPQRMTDAFGREIVS